MTSRCTATLCGKLMTRADLRDTDCPCLCTDCCDRIDRDYEAKRDEQDLGWFGEE
jgi:hypothetical protein